MLIEKYIDKSRQRSDMLCGSIFESFQVPQSDVNRIGEFVSALIVGMNLKAFNFSLDSETQRFESSTNWNGG